MKFEFKLKPEPSFEYTRGKCYFVKDYEGDTYAAYITGWTENAQVIYFKTDVNDAGYKVTHSTLRHLKDYYTIISEVNHITFGA